jgi:hypothetical protein
MVAALEDILAVSADGRSLLALRVIRRPKQARFWEESAADI